LRLTLKIAIAGGGIAGLTAAIALAKHGHHVTVFERATKLDDIGAGIQLSPNAGRVLSGLCLESAVRAISFEPEFLHLIDGKTGTLLTSLPFKALMQRRYGAPYLVTHRGDLQMALLEAAKANPNIAVETGIEVPSFQQKPQSVNIAGRDFDALVAADGINSALRGQIDSGAYVSADSQTAWRANLPLNLLPSEPVGKTRQNISVCVYMSRGAHLVAYKMGARPMLNLVYVSNSKQPPTMNGFAGEAKALIGAAQDWKSWPLATVMCSTWHKGRAVMIGDAAHAMTPHVAQGGAMAIEDAAVLATAFSNLEGAHDIARAFDTFSAERIPRVERVRRLSKQNRRIYQMGGIAAIGRAIVTPLLPPERLLQRLDWLYGCDGVSPD
jgi:salicylate hydroxylase